MQVDVFTDNFISGQRFYYNETGKVASIIATGRVDTEKAKSWFLGKYNNLLVHYKDKRRWSYDKHGLGLQDGYYMLEGEILVNIDLLHGIAIYFTENGKERAEEICHGFIPFLWKKRRRPQEYNVIVKGEQGPELLPIRLPRMKVPLDTHYNDDLAATEVQLLKILRSKIEKGLHLLYGAPGTGKSTYLRRIISKVRNKHFIFLSPRLAAGLDSPGLIPLLLRNTNSILIIEDAEDLLVSRDRNQNSAISFLLNLTDGLLGASLNIQVICTFNTSISALDKALLRKGRLRTLYEFKALEGQKASLLVSKLTGELRDEKSLTLAEIYNNGVEDHARKTQRTSIGFGALSHNGLH